MKRNFVSKKILAGIIAGLTMVAGLSAKDARLGVKVKKNADNATVIDWTDRALGEVSAPTWLKNLRRGNASTFKKEWEMDSSRIVKVSMATGKTEATAQALSRSGFAYAQAAELNQKVIGRVGQGLNDEGQLEALFVAASETKAEMAGLREEASFWQKVRTTTKDAKGKKVNEEKYIYYTVYSMDKTTWDNICKKYLMDIMGGADLTSETKKKVGALFSEMKEDADKKDAKKQAEEEALYKAQMARLETERAKANAEAAASNAETAKARLEGKKLDAQEAQTKAAVEEAEDLASYLM
ncbi:MAG: hypothetical protein KIG70_09410 [Treponema sp.]|uniref:hypothetical protein n=1 Tax=Treponema sp. TaxID=166 RepID=UPI001D720310|nr:hypothetical protein [Treponema sp.]MBS7311385.1 hypothetical protein [Treponema sp.]MDD5810814.1 hypothetical protein [Treponema sp.]